MASCYAREPELCVPSDPRAVASECGDGGTCSTQTCGQLELGACGATKPACP